MPLVSRSSHNARGERLWERQETLPATTASPKPPLLILILSHPQAQTLEPLLALGQQAELSSCAGSPAVLQLSHCWHKQEQQQGEAGSVSTAIPVLLNCCFPFLGRQKIYFTKQTDPCFHRRAGGSRTQEFLCPWQRAGEQLRAAQRSEAIP